MIKKAVLYSGIPLLSMYIVVLLLENLIYKNPSISEPTGYYLSLPGVSYTRNNLVLTCISDDSYKHVFTELGMHDDGACKNGLPYLLKRIAAVEGDKVEITSSGVLVNGVIQFNSKQYQFGRGVNLHPLPLGWVRVLRTGELFMLGESPHSVDSRYFGVIYSKDVYRRAIKFKGL